MTKRNSYLLKKYGITEAQYNEILQQQNGCCAVCSRPAGNYKTKLCVDHDHYTGCIRGLLCIYCNRRIVGRHRRDKGANLLKAAYEYLIKDYSGWVVPAKEKKRKKHGKKLRINRN